MKKIFGISENRDNNKYKTHLMKIDEIIYYNEPSPAKKTNRIK